MASKKNCATKQKMPITVIRNFADKLKNVHQRVLREFTKIYEKKFAYFFAVLRFRILLIFVFLVVGETIGFIS